ncbi:MAG: enoyl-CoA hydratase-related protein [Mariniphaga sp.]
MAFIECKQLKDFTTILATVTDGVATLSLARPDVHNAINNTMITEISSFFTEIEEDGNVRLVVIRGQGKSFCAGADLQWMKKSFTLSAQGNLEESEALSGLFKTIFNSSKIVIAEAHGNIFGGGVGLIAVCDLAYCTDNSRFSLSETRIGMAAATITPYLLQKIRSTDLKELIFTAKNFNGEEAVRYGLINQSFNDFDKMELYLNELIDVIMSNGKQALFASKKLINRLILQPIEEEMKHIPALFAKIRVSTEAQEGFTAFLEKKNPKWQAKVRKF